MNVKLKRLLMPLLRHDAAGKPPTFRTRSAARQAIYLIEKPVSLKSKAAKVRQRIEKQSSRASHNQETAKIREAVMKRADGFCESCRLTCAVLQMDHWLGGAGRRRQMQSVATCWALCAYCHLRRTANAPHVGYWNDTFAAHCAFNGYSFTPHVEHADPAKAGGAP